MLNSPLKWAGGKSQLRKQIIPLIPDHVCYIEPFGGAGWVLLGKAPSQVEVLNDIDGELVNLFRVIRDNPDGLIQSFQWDLVSREEFQALIAQDPRDMGLLERAHRFYYLIMAGWGGQGKYPRFQTAVKDPGGHGNRLAGALETMEEKIKPVHRRLRTVLIENMNWRECIDRYDSQDTLIYVDPPYQGNGVDYRFNMKSQKEHMELRQKLEGSQGRWMLSAYDNAETEQMYQGHWITQVDAPSGMDAKEEGKRRRNTEVVISNFQPRRSGMERMLDISDGR